MRRSLKEQQVLNNLSVVTMSGRGEMLAMAMNAADRRDNPAPSREPASRTRPGHIR